jgi:hypothetical protein
MSPTFTVEQANRMLPLVRRIVRDIVDAHARWQQVLREFELVTASSTVAHPSPGAEALQREAQALARDIEGFISELRNLGVELKGPDVGLVDFPGEMGGRPVWLCWKLDEDAVRFWHEMDEGFSGRRPLVPVLQES